MTADLMEPAPPRCSCCRAVLPPGDAAELTLAATCAGCAARLAAIDVAGLSASAFVPKLRPPEPIDPECDPDDLD